ncbi:MAG: hypothetical protein ABSB84_12790 [Verrucomicrobiota bacterium]|jgi:hypothetical protein
MKKRPTQKGFKSPGENQVSELLILPDGRILVHNLTQPFAELLAELNPDCEQIASRSSCRTEVKADVTQTTFALLRRGQSRIIRP